MHSPAPRIAQLVLCTPAGKVLGQLPPFQASLPWWQEAQDLVAWVRAEYGLDLTILRILDASRPAPPGGQVTYLAEIDGAQAGGLPLTKWPGALEPHPLRLPYAEPGGPSKDLAWADATLEDQGFVRAGAPQQMRTWNLSSLWRIPIEGGLVWLKCVPPFFAHEGAVIRRLQGGPVPQLLAHQPGKVLMADIPGEDLYGARMPTLLMLVSMLVSLQTEWCGREDELLSLGMPDWRGDSLPVAIESVAQRRWSELANDDRSTVAELIDQLPRRFSSLAECGLPDSLVHGDFAPGNARGRQLTSAGERRQEDSIVLLDWGDCGLGHPLLDMSTFIARVPSESAAPVKIHWRTKWLEAVPDCDPARAAEILEPVAAARQAVIYQKFLDLTEPTEHRYHRGDPTVWLRRAAELANGL